MKIIFLDFDGVLNSIRYMVNNIEAWNKSNVGMIDEKAVELLNFLVEKTNAKIVISSSWRLHFTLEQLNKFLIQKGFKGEIIGKTPNPFLIGVDNEHEMIFSQRGHEIQKWMRTQKEPIESFVILDDNSDMAHLKSFLVQTSWEEGMNIQHIEKAVEILNKRPVPTEQENKDFPWKSGEDNVDKN